MTKINSLSDRDAIFNAQRDELIAAVAKRLEGYIGEPVTHKMGGYFLTSNNRLVAPELWTQAVPVLLDELLKHPYVKNAGVGDGGVISVDLLPTPSPEEIVVELVV